MADSTFPAELPAPRPLRRLVVENLGLATVIFALLECWRPLYFLTDDNLDEGFPLWAGMGRRLIQGQSPAVADYLFGGHYSLLRDSSNFCFCWHPFYLLAALLTQTPASLFATEFAALFFVWLAVSGFVCLADQLRRELRLPLGDWRLMLLAQSFTFSMIALCTGSSWVDFLANHSALPWLALGIVQTQWRRGLALTAVFCVHQLLGGHLGMVISCSLLLTIFALGVAWLRRTYVPLLSWFGGFALALLVLSPLFIPATQGFFATHRAQGFSESFMDLNSFPALLLPFSYFLGVFSWYGGIDFRFGYCAPWYSAAFASCAAAWLIVPALASRVRWSGLEILCAGLVMLAALLAIRPVWLGEIMTHIPLLRSMRWPFREIMEMQFFLHLFLVLRPLGGPPMFQRVMAFTGIFVFVCPLFFLPAPSFWPMEVDRQLIFSGTSVRFWDKVKPLLEPGDVIVPVMNPNLGTLDAYLAPYSLIAAYNYPELLQVKSGVGYLLTVPDDELYIKTYPPSTDGAYLPDQEAAVLKERPNARFITLESVRPLRITLSSPKGPIDVTHLLGEP